MSYSCPVCRGTQTKIFLELTEMPVSIGIQWPTAEEARAADTGDVRLGFCGHCGFIWNCAFVANQPEYSQRYDNSLDFSPAFQEYARSLARHLIKTYGIRGKQVIELGCGKGHFLTLLCEEGNNRGVGFDPSYEGARIQSAATNKISYIQDFYGEKYTEFRGDLICCRHVLEHIPEPVPFLRMIQRTMNGRNNSVLYVEVPNIRFILQRLSIWDIIYEHCSYFSRESLGYLFRSCGFQVLDLRDTYDGQFLAIEAALERPLSAVSQLAPEDTQALSRAVDAFAENVRKKREDWQRRLTEISATGRKTVIWGGGAKAVSFLNMLTISDTIPSVVDINPHKQGLYLAGTGQKIIAPESLKELQPDIVIIMNAIYRKEITTNLDRLGLSPQIWEA